jgi:hypothetical protein
MSSAEMFHTEASSLLSSSVDLLIQDSPDLSTCPKIKPPNSGFGESTAKKEDTEVQVKKLKMCTVFSQTQQCVLNDRFRNRSTSASSRCKNFLAF